MMGERLFLVAHVAGRAVAIDAAQVESVVDLGPTIPVPGALDEVLGLAALRSRVVTVIDTLASLGLPGGAMSGRRAVITRIDEHLYAVPVDTLEDVAAFTLQPLPVGLRLDGRWAAIGRGLVERDGETLLAIDLGALVPSHAPGLSHAA